MTFVIYYYTTILKERRVVMARKDVDLTKNVHFWLRKVFLFVFLSEDESYVDVSKAPHKGEKGTKESDLRTELGKWLGKWRGDYPDNSKITKQEAEEACQELYKIFLEPFETKIQNEIEDPHCPGGKPQGSGYGR